MKLAVTGHRPNKLNNEYINKFELNNMYNNYGPMSKWIFDEIQAVLKYKQVTHGITGMALGVDQIFAHACLNMGVPYTAAVPCDNQDKMWTESNKEWYQYLINNADKIVIVCPGPYAGWKMQKRNEWMCDNADELLGIYDGTNGGTGNCIKYAELINLKTQIINPREYGINS